MKEVVSLREYIERILEEKDKAVNIALAAAKEAVGVAEKNAEKWRDQANEWRGAMTDREKTFATKAEVAAYKESTERALAVEKERSDKGEGRGVGLAQGWSILLATVGLAGGLIGIIAFLSK